MSHVMSPMSHVSSKKYMLMVRKQYIKKCEKKHIHFFQQLDKVVELLGGGSVINRANPTSLCLLYLSKLVQEPSCPDHLLNYLHGFLRH